MSREPVAGLLRAAWRRMWESAPRQLRFTRAGRVLVGLALVTGFAAVNTGNNLLFLGWGLVLSAIVLSGILSEGVVRNLRVTAGPAPRLRAGEPGHLALRLDNLARRAQAYAIEVSADVEWDEGEAVVAAPPELRLEPGASRALLAGFTPLARGRHRVARLRARTSYPFGFFEKARRFDAGGQVFWVMPAAVSVRGLVGAVEAAAGETPALRPGPGDELFSLRPYRPGDDPRRIAHRRSARTGRWVVRESEATSGGAVLLELRLGEAAAAPPGTPRRRSVERAIAAFGSLAEALLARGRAVGIAVPGAFLPPDAGAGQGWRILGALARLDPGAGAVRVPAVAARVVVLTPAPGTETGLAVVAPPGRAGAPELPVGPAPERARETGRLPARGVP